MAATQPTRRPWHSGTDALWAASAAAGDAESAPVDGEKIAGHVNNTGYTSGRANWLWAAVAEWLQRVRNTLLPQHEDAGGHSNVTIVGTAAGVKCTITSSAGEAAGTRMLDIVDADGALGAFVDKEGDALVRSLTVGDPTNGTSATKLIVHTDNGEAASDKQVILNDQAGAESLSVQSDGIVNVTQVLVLGLSPAMFHTGISVAGANSAGVYHMIAGADNCGMNAADAVMRAVFCPELRLNEGDIIDTVTLYANRGGAAGSTCTIYLKNKSAAGTTQTVGNCAVPAGAGAVNNNFAPAHTVTMAKGYWWELEIANNGGADDIVVTWISVAITRKRLL